MASGWFFTQAVTNGAREEGKQLLGRRAREDPVSYQKCFPSHQFDCTKSSLNCSVPFPVPLWEGQAFICHLQCITRKELLSLIKTRHGALHGLAEDSSGRRLPRGKGAACPFAHLEFCFHPSPSPHWDTWAQNVTAFFELCLNKNCFLWFCLA